MLKGRIAFVTGGTGAIGSAIVRSLAAHGARVAFSFHSQEDKARELERELGGERAKAYLLDVLDKAGSVKVAEQVEQELGPVDILVNNAGITQVMPFALIEEEDWDRMMDVNVKGMFLVTKAFVRGMIRRKTRRGREPRIAGGHARARSAGALCDRQERGRGLYTLAGS